MAELGLERHPAAISHSELTAGHDVTHLLSQINQNYTREQSKADQILRLLQDQNRENIVHEKSDDDSELLNEYNKIREEKEVCDSDTLTDSSSISDILECDIAETETIRNSSPAMNNQVTSSGVDEGIEARGYRGHRSRTSMGFRGEEDQGSVIDTRDISIRPKSSYVRRRPLKTCFENEGTSTASGTVAEDIQQQPQRMSKSARPKSRLGRASVSRAERKIVMIEADSVNVEPTTPVRNEPTRAVANNTNTYDRFSSVRQAKRESKRETKRFCDYNESQQTVENMSVDSSNSVEMKEELTEVQPLMPQHIQHSYVNKENEVTNAPIRHQTHVSSFNNHAVSRNSNVPPQQQHQQYSSQRRNIMTASRPEMVANMHQQHSAVDQQFVRSNTMVGNASLRSSDRRENAPVQPLKRTNSNLGYRSKNAEQTPSRTAERPDIRPSTRTRRLQRRFMPQAPPHMSNVRPTSESVILARQKTEKNLLKKQTDNRPHSEKIMINSQGKGMLSVAENPTQGPQTFVTSKGGVTQASHVQSGGFRGYDPGNRLKSGAQSRDFPSDLTLPRQGQNNMMMGSRKTLAAMMKLPPLEASLAAKKKERGLTLAQRETCV